MDNSFSVIGLRQIKERLANCRQWSLGEDFCMTELRYDSGMSKILKPARLGIYVAFFCLNGKIRLNINLKEYVLEEGQALMLYPGYLVQILDVEMENKEDFRGLALCATREYLSTLHIDLTRLFSEGASLLDSPLIKLSMEGKLLTPRYFDLIAHLINTRVPNMRACIGSVLSSLFYFSEGVISEQLEASKGRVTRATRADDVLNQFINLLTESYKEERSVAFYAEKLCISPKYFSKLIKEASGRTVPEWIDSFVIMEARNLLKFTDLSIKQIIAHLHFTDQPTFTKFFKSHTGVTPAQYRRQQ